MTDQRPTSDENPEPIPEPTEWSPTSAAVQQSNSPAVPEYVPTSFAEARARLEAIGEAELKGSIFPVVDKEVLLKVPFIVLDYQWNKDKDTGNPFVSLHVIDSTDQRWCVNDGGTGIFKQMQQWEHDFPERRSMIDIPNGLRKSDYTAKWKEVDKETGELVDKQGPATTYYFA
jgi:hypothetical protein